jgi:hypothetical protein
MYDLFSSSFSKTENYFSNSSSSLSLSASASFSEFSLFILLFSCLMTVIFSMILFLVTFYIFSSNLRFYCLIAFKSSSYFYIPFFKAAYWPINLNHSSWHLNNEVLLSFSLLLRYFFSCYTFWAKLSIRPTLYCF